LNPPTVVVRPKFPGEEKDETFPVRAYRQIPSPRNGFGHRENSRNWSGAYITPHPRPNRFLQVAGAWTVPLPTAPSIPPNLKYEEYRSSSWIGIGGHRSYNTLPQIGTSQNVGLVNGHPTPPVIGAWWQWWVKSMPEHHVPIPIVNFEVSAYDD